jgi:hypothetical protein
VHVSHPWMDLISVVFGVKDALAMMFHRKETLVVAPYFLIFVCSFVPSQSFCRAVGRM